ncbi:MAG: MGMT family protein [Patescibacteria group bacterium]
MKELHEAVLLLKKIPKGKVATYKEMARVCATSARAIGKIMATNPDPKNFPCYKVVAYDGSLGGYSGRGGLKEKRRLLAKEGIRFEKGRVREDHFHYFGNRGR